MKSGETPFMADLNPGKPKNMEAKLTITGHVQGVFFRANGKEKAQELGLTGWIKNDSEGSVSACVQGLEKPVQTFIDWCQEGPPSAQVESINIEKTEGKPEKSFENFEIIY